MNCDDSPGLAWTQQDLYIPQPTTAYPFQDSHILYAAAAFYYWYNNTKILLVTIILIE